MKQLEVTSSFGTTSSSPSVRVRADDGSGVGIRAQIVSWMLVDTNPCTWTNHVIAQIVSLLESLALWHEGEKLSILNRLYKGGSTLLLEEYSI